MYRNQSLNVEKHHCIYRKMDNLLSSQLKRNEFANEKSQGAIQTNVFNSYLHKCIKKHKRE